MISVFTFFTGLILGMLAVSLVANRTYNKGFKDGQIEERHKERYLLDVESLTVIGKDAVMKGNK